MKVWHIAATSLIPCIGILAAWRPWDPGQRAAQRPAHRQAPTVLEERAEVGQRAAPEQPIAASPLMIKAEAHPPAEADDAAKQEATDRPAHLDVHDVFAHCEATFSSETADRAWAPKSERALHDKVGALLSPGASLRSTECRASMCRLEVKFETEAARHSFLQSAFSDIDKHIWNGNALTGPTREGHADDEVGVIAFLMREGEPFPSL